MYSTVYAQDDLVIEKNETIDKDSGEEEKLKLTLHSVLDYILRQNLDVKKALLEYQRAGTDLKKYRGIYDPSLSGSAKYSDINKSPDNPANTFQGKEIKQHDYTVGIGKYFSTGTSMQVSVNSLYQDVQGAVIPMPTGPINLGGEGYQTTVQATLSQELLKNTFGINTRLNEQLLSNSTRMKKEAIKYQLSNLVVEALVGYWNVAIAEESLETARLNLNSTKEIRNLVRSKLSLGLSEREEVLDWNSKVLQLQNAFDQTDKQLYDARLAVLRVLNMEPDTEFEILTKLTTTSPDITYEQAIKDAFSKRVDLKNQRLAMHNAELGMRMATHDTLPSVKMNMSAGTVD
ncbi:MAG TPA: TolC family protein [Spirochaetota bacterium]|nr:TolC family protein [Spirochaetota bacterium]